MINFTCFAASAPINKKITQAEDGSLIKESLAHQAYGSDQTTATVISVGNLSLFGQYLNVLENNHCLSYGIPKGLNSGSSVQIVTKDQEQQNPFPGRISRSRDNFHFVTGEPGILMLDYDPHSGKPALAPDDLILAIKEICPELVDVEMLYRPSASSSIFDVNDHLLRGIAGQRLYIIVSDASLIPQYAERIKSRCWLTGFGRFDVSRAGSLLERGLIDFCVYQPERLDFCGKTVLGSGLKQLIPPPQLISGNQQFLDFSGVPLQITAEEQIAIDAAKQKARDLVSEERQRIRDLYIEEKLQEQIIKEEIDPDDQDKTNQIRRNIRRATENKILDADFQIQLHNREVVTVGELLEHPDKYHLSECHDPLEPEYGNSDSRIGIIRLKDGRPHIYSHAHGGQLYRLIQVAREIEIIAGDHPRIIRECVEALKSDGTTFVYGEGDNAVLAHAPTLYFGVQPYSEETLALNLDECINFYQNRVNRNGEVIRTIQNCPPRLSKTLLKAIDYWSVLPILNAVVTNPICRLDGSLISKEGYDKQTKLLLVKRDPDENWDIPLSPTTQEVRDAVILLLNPFRYFPFENAVDRGTFLSALLTSVVRPVLRTAPAYLYSAACPGTGKTLLAQCTGALQTGQTPSAIAPPESEEEMQKLILSSLLSGNHIQLIDNIEAPLKSAALCAVLTSEFFSGRILGVSKVVNLPNRILTLLTGNNVQVLGDLNRRVMPIKIIADVERPEKREFDFNPLELTKSSRLQMVKAALTVIYAAAIEVSKRRHDVGSYQDWNQLVRHSILWIIKCKSEDPLGWSKIPELADPMESFDNSFDADPELQLLSLLLSILGKVFGNQAFTVADILTESIKYKEVLGGQLEHPELAPVINDIAADRGKVNSKRLGQYLKRYADRIVDGLALVRAGKNRGTKTNMFRVESKAEAISGVTGVSGVSPVQYGSNSNVVNINGQNQSPVTLLTPECVQTSQNISE